MSPYSRPVVDHAEGREPAQRRRERDEQAHAEQEVRRRVQEQRDRVADVVDEPAAFPAGVRAEGEAEHDRDELAEAEQEERGSRVATPRSSVTVAAGLDEREAEVALERRTDVRDELVREERLVEAPALAGALEDLLA